ncbi:MAG TPA: threonine/serine exporter family protein [Phycisphaerales bacterium]|nr:threonine/serine exporter family protein [Phycisphaerales bacterium]
MPGPDRPTDPRPLADCSRPCPGDEPPTPEDHRAVQLLCDLGVALCESGTPAHRLEDALTSAAAVLRVEACFFAMPTALFASFDRLGPGSARLLRVQSADTHLARLIELGSILDDVLAHRLQPAEGIRRIALARTRPSPYGRILTVACFACVAACSTRFFGGGLREVAVAPLAGLAVGLLTVFGGSRLARLTEFLAGAVAAMVAVAAAALLDGASARSIMLGGLIVLIPGLSLTLSVTELATRNLVAGTARLMGALSTFVAIGFGVATGQQLLRHAARLPVASLEAPSTQTVPPAWTLTASLVIVALPLTVLFRARARDALVIMGSAFLAFYGARVGAWVLGPETGACIAAMIVGIGANLYARLTGNPAAVPLLPGVLLLVPGSVGFRSVQSFVANDALGGVATAFEMIYIAISIVAGLLIANAAMPSKRPL